ncbi:hydrogenase iron-sulfur subunit [candidate division KSB1 bacterium]|nr:hydrogenase iron-sulfur subunit [candidate division KSB1 bacterium]
MPNTDSNGFEPKIICFLCKWCTYAGADLAGTSRMQYAPNGVNIRLMCSSRLDPQHILWAFEQGADGVLVGGCHPGDCHYQEGNYKTLRRMTLLEKLLIQFGLEKGRLRLEWISAAEGNKFVEVMNEFTEQIRSLGPLKLRTEERR